MYEELIFAGFGGQGVILSGKIMCIAAMLEGKSVSHLPSYGAEMRGGTANCSVILSDTQIASPIISTLSCAVVLNKPSLLKFEKEVIPGGVLIYNASLIDIKPERDDIEVVPVNASELAAEEGSVKAANMVAIGALLKRKPMVLFDSVIAALEEAVSSRNKTLNEINRRAIKKGYESV